MQEQFSKPLVQPAAPSSPVVKLWTPGWIAGLSLFLGFATGMVLASINWMRMNMNNKALIHLIVGIVGTFLLALLLILISGDIARLVALVVNLGAVFYLYRQMDKDLRNFRAASNKVENANGLGGCLIGLGILIVFIIFNFALSFVLVMLGIPIPE